MTPIISIASTILLNLQDFILTDFGFPERIEYDTSKWILFELLHMLLILTGYRLLFHF